MNYYMPFNNLPYQTQKIGLLNRIFKNGFNWSSILNNTQKTLNIINQTIPVIKQVKPVVNNAKTMFKVMNEFKKIDTPKNNNIIKTDNLNKNINNKEIIKKNDGINKPTFFQ